MKDMEDFIMSQVFSKISTLSSYPGIVVRMTIFSVGMSCKDGKMVFPSLMAP